jgi:ABC-type multidrug transport system fused ATPase/permease subunit
VSRTSRIRELAPFLGMSRGIVALLAGAAVLAGFAEAAVLSVIAYTATTLSQSGGGSVPLEVSGQTFADITIPTLLAIAFALVVVRLALQEVGAYLPARLNADLQLTVRDDLWASFLSASWSVQSQEREGGLQGVLTTQVTQATQAVLTAATGFSAGVTFVALLVAALLINVFAAAVTIVVGSVLFLALRPLTRLARRFTHDLGTATVDYGSNISESVRLAEEIGVFDVGAEVKQRSHGLAQRIRHAAFWSQLLSRNIAPLYQSAAMLIIIGALGGLYATDSTRVAALGAVVLILVRALSYGQAMQSAYHAVNESIPLVDLVQSAHARYLGAEVGDGEITLASVTQLEFRHVSFCYGAGPDVLDDVSFVVSAGETVGIVGPSGAGKSTLVQLVLRLRSATRGTVLVNGRSIDDFSRPDWLRRVAFVPQEPQLFSGSVRDNIRFFRPWITDHAVQEAARRAHVHSEILGFQDGYETVIGQRADAVSGGQRQRICMARALVGSPDFLVLDEPTSALDMRSEELLRRSFEELRGTVTLLIIAHRLSTLNVCDRIMVFAAGRLEAFASATELVNRNEFFRDAVSLTRVSGAHRLP